MYGEWEEKDKQSNWVTSCTKHSHFSHFYFACVFLCLIMSYQYIIMLLISVPSTCSRFQCRSQYWQFPWLLSATTVLLFEKVNLGVLISLDAFNRRVSHKQDGQCLNQMADLDLPIACIITIITTFIRQFIHKICPSTIYSSLPQICLPSNSSLSQTFLFPFQAHYLSVKITMSSKNNSKPRQLFHIRSLFQTIITSPLFPIFIKWRKQIFLEVQQIFHSLLEEYNNISFFFQKLTDFENKENKEQKKNTNFFCFFQKNQPTYFFILPSLPTHTHIIAPFFSTILPSQPQFQITKSQTKSELNLPKRKLIYRHQANEVSLEGVSSKVSKQMTDGQKLMKQFSQKNEKKKTKIRPMKKIYEKDRERNILPNAMSKMFFFLKSMGKSEDLLKEILKHHQDLNSLVTPSKYYVYQNVLKSNRGRFMTVQSIQCLFTFVDQNFTIFTRAEQVAFIKINSIMMRLYIKQRLFLPHLLTSKRIAKDKIKTNLEKYHEISNKIDELILNLKQSGHEQIHQHIDILQ